MNNYTEIDLKALFLFEMEQQGISTLEDLFDGLTQYELDSVIKIVCSKEFQNIYFYVNKK